MMYYLVLTLFFGGQHNVFIMDSYLTREDCGLILEQNPSTQLTCQPM